MANQKYLSGSADIDFAPAVSAEPLAPEVLTPDQIAKIIKHRSAIESWFKRVEEWATNEMVQGREIEGLKLVKGRAVRRWKGGDEAVALQLLQRGVAEPWAKKLKGITEVEKLLGKGKISDITEAPEPPLKAAAADDKRPAVKVGATVAEEFEF